MTPTGAGQPARTGPVADAAEQGVRWVRADPVVWRRSLDQVVLLPPAAGEPMALSGAAVAAWELLAQPQPLAALVATLAELYDVRPEAIEPDVAALLTRLRELAAVRCEP